MQSIKFLKMSTKILYIKLADLSETKKTVFNKLISEE